jgi:hypothetical protein
MKTTNARTKNLLAVNSDAKTVKGSKHNVLTGIMYLAPHTLAGPNICPMAEAAGCVDGCLNTAGRGAMTYVQERRIAKTRWYHEDPVSFLDTLRRNIRSLVRRADRIGAIPMVRLNGTSDIMWERKHPEILDEFPNVQFYDYTKIPVRSNVLANYHLTWSYSGVLSYARHLDTALVNGMNVAVVFRNHLPDTFLGMPVINGDDSDVRPYDPEGVVVGLTAKGRAKKDTSGFVIDVD